MASYRCVCRVCSGFITSSNEPVGYGEEFHRFHEEWAEECRRFLETPCPHYGDGHENCRVFHSLEKPQEEDL